MRSVFILFLIFVSTSVHAVVFNMAPLEFSNRAGCADLSAKPARSVFLQIDSFNAGKAGFAQGLLGQRIDPKTNPSTIAEKGAKDFRLWSTHLAYEILNALKTGKLPLLDQEGATPSIYKDAVNKCLSKKHFLSCSAMNDLLSEIWSRSKMKDPRWQELGLTQDDFFSTTEQPEAALGCHIVRKYSSFHSPLQTPALEKGTITNIGIEAFRPYENLDSCFSITEGKDPRFTTVQFDIANLKDEHNWDLIGFKFWHSFKLFYSWGWRYAPEYQEEYGTLKQAFSSIAFEDSVMLLPNGCRSVEAPKCDSAGLTTDVLRAAKFLGTTHPAMNELPPKPIDMLFQGKAQYVNNDSMGLFKAENASAWNRDFKEKLSSIRFEMQRKINTGLGKLQVITALVTPEDLTKDITNILQDTHYDQIETYLACMEYTLAKNSLFNDIDAEIQTLNNTTDLQSVLLAESGKNLVKYVDYYKSLTNTMKTFCKSLEDNGRAAPDTNNPELLKSLNEWAFGLLRPIEKNTYNNQCAVTPDHAACPKNQDKKFLVTKPRQANGAGDEFTVCKTSLECARTILDSLISIISVRRYAEAFLPLDEVIKSPNIFNNYANPTACKLYDPWSKQRNALKLFVADLGSALLQGASCGALNYRVLQLPTENVIGFQTLMEAENTNYTPITQHEKTKYVGGVDYAFLPGLTCGAAVSNTILNHRGNTIPGYYGALEVRKCDGKSKTEYVVNPNARLDPSFNNVIRSDADTTQRCFSCNVALSSLAQYACTTPYIGQIAATGIGLFQGIIRLYANLSDANDIVRTKELNVDQIAVSFGSKVTQPKSCHNKLKRGITCTPKKVRGKK